MSPELSSRLTTAVERMPAFPKSVQQILQLTRDINCPPKALVAVIEKDPVIAIKILKIVNSAYFSLPSKITSINQSVVFLGMNTLKNLALNFSTIGMLPQKNAAGFDIQHYLMHSLLTAGITRMLVERYADGEADMTDAYTVGLLHNFGKVVFAQFMPQEFHQALEFAANADLPLHKAEEHVIGADHALVGAMLAQRWQFAPSLVECIGGHHQGSGAGALGECLHVADLIAEQLCDDAAAEQGSVTSDEALPERFGGDLAGVAAGLRGLDKIAQDARQFCQSEALK
ncbi:MAG: HDOD domain-containing protein [Burkholderiales bacterium]|nr:HDOD domain-containing protein [Burkholderiales bacterium]